MEKKFYFDISIIEGTMCGEFGFFVVEAPTYAEAIKSLGEALVVIDKANPPEEEGYSEPEYGIHVSTTVPEGRDPNNNDGYIRRRANGSLSIEN